MKQAERDREASGQCFVVVAHLQHTALPAPAGCRVDLLHCGTAFAVGIGLLPRVAQASVNDGVRGDGLAAAPRHALQVQQSLH